MKALSIMQPWAWLIVNGFKDIENRDWRYKPKFRGEFLVHAGQKFDFDGARGVEELFPEIKLPSSSSRWRASAWQLGGIVGRAELVDVISEKETPLAGLNSPWFTGPLGFVLRNAVPLPFVPCRGQLGFFNVGEK